MEVPSSNGHCFLTGKPGTDMVSRSDIINRTDVNNRTDMVGRADAINRTDMVARAEMVGVEVSGAGYQCGVCGRQNLTLLQLEEHRQGHEAARLLLQQHQIVFPQRGAEGHWTSQVPPPMSGSGHVHAVPQPEKSNESTTWSNSHDTDIAVKEEHIEDIYSCSLCRKVFHKEADLVQHDKTHAWVKDLMEKFLSQSILECSICDVTCASAEMMREHHNAHIVDTGVYRCLACKAQFTGEDRFLMLLYHMVTDHDKKTPFVCSDCGKYFLDRLQLRRHSQIHSPNKEQTCHICHMTFKRQYRLKIHMNKHTGDKPYKCKECDQAFPSPWTLAKHSGCQAGKKFVCDLCHQAVPDQRSLLDHKVRVHQGTAGLKCPECGIPFSSKMYMAVHLRNAHGISEKDRPTSHQCSVCKKYCKTASSLNAHMKTHTSVNFFCPLCNKGFISANNLQQHTRVHLSTSGEMTAENYRKCRYCGKEFASRKQCAKHMVTHTKVKAHVCEVCGKQYGLKASLAKHMVSNHMSEADIAAVLCCEICGLRCFNVPSLEAHMIMHSIPKELVCFKCGESFSDKKELRAHKKAQHSQAGKQPKQEQLPEIKPEPEDTSPNTEYASEKSDPSVDAVAQQRELTAADLHQIHANVMLHLSQNLALAPANIPSQNNIVRSLNAESAYAQANPVNSALPNVTQPNTNVIIPNVSQSNANVIVPNVSQSNANVIDSSVSQSNTNNVALSHVSASQPHTNDNVLSVSQPNTISSLPHQNINNHDMNVSTVSQPNHASANVSHVSNVSQPNLNNQVSSSAAQSNPSNQNISNVPQPCQPNQPNQNVSQPNSNSPVVSHVSQPNSNSSVVSQPNSISDMVLSDSQPNINIAGFGQASLHNLAQANMYSNLGHLYTGANLNTAPFISQTKPELLANVNPIFAHHNFNNNSVCNFFLPTLVTNPYSKQPAFSNNIGLAIPQHPNHTGPGFGQAQVRDPSVTQTQMTNIASSHTSSQAEMPHQNHSSFSYTQAVRECHTPNHEARNNQ